MEFSDFLTSAMKEKGFTDAYLSDLTGLSRPLIHYYKNGKANPKQAALQKIETALGAKYGKAETPPNRACSTVPHERITLREAARMMHISDRTLAEKLQNGELSNIGWAYRSKGSSKFTYHIIPNRFYELYGKY